MSNLPDLPGSDDKEFWGDADINVASYNKHECEHEFIETGRREITCSKCGWGLYLDVEDVFKDGTVTRRGKKLPYGKS